MKFGGVVLALVLLGAVPCVQAAVFTENIGHSTGSRYSGAPASGSYGWVGVSQATGPANSWEVYRKYDGTATVNAVTLANNGGNASKADAANLRSGADVYTGLVFVGPNGTLTPNSTAQLAIGYLNPTGGNIDLRIGFMEASGLGAWLTAKGGDGYDSSHKSTVDLFSTTPTDMVYLRYEVSSAGAVGGSNFLYTQAGNGTQAENGTARGHAAIASSSGSVGTTEPLLIQERLYDSGGGQIVLEVTLGGLTQTSPVLNLSQDLLGVGYNGGSFDWQNVTPVIFYSNGAFDSGYKAGAVYLTPEPATMALLALGGLGLLARRRRG